jgi:hypothetical protein
MADTGVFQGEDVREEIRHAWTIAQVIRIFKHSSFAWRNLCLQGHQDHPQGHGRQTGPLRSINLSFPCNKETPCHSTIT